MNTSTRQVWTIGHSIRTADDFINLLEDFTIQTLVDVRHFPGSRKYPHFNKEQLEELAIGSNIIYVHLVDLGGRRKPVPGSKNTAWRHEAFRGYADYMQTGSFQNAMKELEELASKSRTAYMCSEAVWWRCHRGLISDYLKIRGWEVLHIMSHGKAVSHPYTSAARIVGSELRYDEPDLFN